MTANPGPGDAPQRIGLDEAYSLQGPDDSRRLYDDWSASYEIDLVDGLGYQYHVRLADCFCAAAERSDGPILDVGCGTGLVGQELAQRGSWAIDGLDLSPEMLTVAAEKRNPAGEPVYGSLVEADLSRPLDISDNTYGAIVSAGMFTLGHVGPGPIAELVRVVRPGGLLVLGVNSRHFEQEKFGSHLERMASDGIVTEPTTTVIKVYDRHDHPHGGDTAHLVTMRAI